MKTDYAKLLASLSSRDYMMFYTLTQNDQYLASTLYTAIINSPQESCDLFLNTRQEFIRWITSCWTDSFTYLDTYILGFISKNKTFSAVYTDAIDDYEHLIRYIISAWKRPVKTLRNGASMCRLIYLRYIKFLASDRGQDFLYGNSLDLYPDIQDDIPYEERPFYEQEIYRNEKLIQFKKHVIKTLCETPLQKLEMMGLWDVTFGDTAFSYRAAREIVRKQISDKAVSDTTLYYHLKRLHVLMLQEILKDGNIDKYFDGDITVEHNGKMMKFSEIIREYLLEAIVQYEKAKKDYVWDDTKIADSVELFCLNHSLKYARIKEGNTVLVKVKSDYQLNRKKGWDLYFLHGGGFIDFSTGEKGFVTDIVPKAYFKRGA